LTRALVASSAIAVLSGAAYAASDAALEAEVRALREELSAMKQQLQSLKQQSGAQFTETLRRQDEAPKLKMDGGRPTFETADGAFTASIRGRLQWDAATYDQDPAGPLNEDFRRASNTADENARARNLADGNNFRRAQIGVEGTLFKEFGYSLSYQFGGSGAEEAGRIQDVYLEYKGIKGWRFRGGAFSPPVNLDDAAGSADTLFLERASAAEIQRGIAGSEGRTGIGALGSGERWTASAVLTGNTIGVSSLGDQLAFVGRGTYLVVNDPQLQLHVGANVTYVFDPADLGRDAVPRTPLRLRDRPEIRVDGTRLIDTGSIDADSLVSPGVEVALRYKALLVQGEYIWYQINRVSSSPLSDPHFSGYYVQAAYTITGEPRRYNAQNGAFTNPRAARFVGGKETDDTAGLGAFEVAARYSVVDLNYHEGADGAATPLDGIRGGRQETVAAGLNWYLNNAIRFSFDYQYIDVDRLSRGGTQFGSLPGETPPAGTQVGQDFKVFSARAQLSF
jgi:phosphate-selective porin OprO/OprP